MYQLLRPPLRKRGSGGPRGLRSTVPTTPGSRVNNENDRLVDLGLKAGRGFLEAVKNKEIPEDVINREVPFVVLTMLQGPSLDFILGQVYEAATTNAADEVMKREGGKQLEPSQWISDKAILKQKAANLFRDRNCALLK